MKKLPASLLKNIVLLSALVATVSNLLFKTPDRNTLLILQIVFGTAYVGFSIAEFLSQVQKASLPYDRFFYLPFNVISTKVIKLGAFLIACVVLSFSTTLIFLAGLLVSVLVSDLLIFLLRLKQKVYYISLFANYVLFSLEEERKVFASQIKTIEYRYEFFYLKLKNNKIYDIDTNRLDKRNKHLFTEKFVRWGLLNRLEFTEEAKEKLADYISDTI
jgi:hypothetical protein